MLKRLVDLAVSALLLLAASPLLVVITLLIYLGDFHNPFYIAPRIGRGGRPFRMVKFRSMVVNADKSGVTSTSATDRRITPVGRFVRAYKLDELVQLWNVLLGDMSLVGPRPNVPSGVATYTPAERRLLDVRPGITDYASIVFADEGEILRGAADPDARYDELIRPWKSRLGLFYVERQTVLLDLKLVVLTAVSIVSRRNALDALVRDLERRGAAPDLVDVSRRAAPLRSAPLP